MVVAAAPRQAGAEPPVDPVERSLLLFRDPGAEETTVEDSGSHRCTAGRPVPRSGTFPFPSALLGIWGGWGWTTQLGLPTDRETFHDAVSFNKVKTRDERSPKARGGLSLRGHSVVQEHLE